MAITRDRLHQLVDELGNEELAPAEQVLKELRAAKSDPLLRKLYAAPVDDEPTSEQDRAAIAASEADVAAGRVIGHDEIRRALDL